MANFDWETPQDFFETLNEEFHFTLDVAADHDNAKCKSFFDPGADGLNQKWEGVCWMNPPYDKSIAKWVEKAYRSAQRGSLVVALLQGRGCDTRWWHDYVVRSSELRFVKDRLGFKRNGISARANISSVIVVFRPFCLGPPEVCSIDKKAEIIFPQYDGLKIRRRP